MLIIHKTAAGPFLYSFRCGRAVEDLKLSKHIIFRY
jgi:hypothetical protein